MAQVASLLFALLSMGMVGGHAVSPAAAADSFPSRPITLLVPFSAGGPTDKLARDLSEAMRQRLGQTVVVENIGGAGGTIGAGKVANARPDGYTLMLVHVGMATWPALYPGWERKTLEAFDYLGLINEVPMTLVGRPTLAPKNIDELTSWLKGNHDKVNLANGGPGSASDLCGLQLQEKLGIKLTTIPYKGTGPAMIDLMGNQLDLLCTMTIGAQDQIKEENQRLRGHLAEARADPGARRAADAGRIRSQGIQRDHMAWTLRPQEHAARNPRETQWHAQGNPGQP